MRDICTGHLRADPCRATAWRLRVILILALAGAAAAAFVPQAARAASRDPYMEMGGGCLTGDPDDGEHKTGPARLPAELPVSGDLPSPSAQTYSVSPLGVSQNSEPSLPAGGRAVILRALARYARPLAWLALSTRQPWVCDPLWLATLQSEATIACQAPAPTFARTR
jgi:hypothetical protein